MSKRLYTYHIAWTVAMACTLCSCSDHGYESVTDEPIAHRILVEGIDTDGMILSADTRAEKPAEQEEWLIQPLKQGLDITYGLYNSTPSHEDVAILRLSHADNAGEKEYDKEGDLAKYTFRYRTSHQGQDGVDNENNAIWYNNGYHYFQGVHVPGRIRYTSDKSEVEAGGKAPGLTSDQHDAETATEATLGNYTLLSHYLSMPANFRLTATVERIKLPFRHRLARVVAFVLIDPILNTTLKGYKKDAAGNAVTTEDPTTTSIRFCNVKVLEGVKDEEETGGHHKLTPEWGVARKVIPHFDGERGSYSYKTLESYDDNFKYYYKESNGKSEGSYPTSPDWQTIHAATGHNGYTEVNYGKVPVYDIIVRPTYTSTDNVMYDEKDYTTQKSTLAGLTNKIDFEIELTNGLRYEKEFEFDLNANYQTVVYLRISREHVDYNAAGSDLWIEEKSNDAWYGVNNQNGNTLSEAGSSWQRAYTYGENLTETIGTIEGVTDGHFYNSSTSADEREKAQFFSAEYHDVWVEKFLQAHQGGEHHGDYFVLRSNITIDARLIPADFVFTGHLDGQDSVITLTHTNEDAYFPSEEYAKFDEHTLALYTKNATGDYVFTEYHIPDLYVCDEVAQAPQRRDGMNDDAGDTPSIPSGPGMMRKLGDNEKPTLVKLMAHNYPEVYYEKVGTAYQVYDPSSWTFYYKHTSPSPSFLFAGLDGKYETRQENEEKAGHPIYNQGWEWEANVHKETNKQTLWVPTLGYRAETLHVKIAAGAALFKEGATITGNVQNCWNGTTPIPNHSPDIPRYK